MTLEQRFVNNFRQRAFYDVGKSVLLAVSGGVDSMVLASLFLENKMKFAIAHCNFNLRGVESNKDEALVRGWCRENDIEFHSVSFDTEVKAKGWKVGIQEAARKLRYDWLESVRVEKNYSYVATAHHANDNAETLLMNLFKGTGISGLHGIQHRNNNVIRPLLFLEKSEILLYATDKNVPYRNDASNELDKYLRNNIRLNLLPEVEKVFPNVVHSLNDSIQRFSEAEVLYQKEIEREKKSLYEWRGNDLYVPALKLKKKEAVATICYELFKDFGFSPKQVPHIVDLLTSESGHYIASKTHRIIRDRAFLIITEMASQSTEFIQIDNLPASIDLGTRTLEVSEGKTPSNLATGLSEVYLCIDKVSFPLVLRKWRLGDYFYPLGMGMKKKKLSKFFIDQKLPIHEKENVWVLESNRRIVWVVGFRLDERFKVLSNSERVLKVQLS